MQELPSLPRAERRDKARNREKVLAAASELFAGRGVEHTTIDEIAARAGVGVGTVYRGFGDMGGLVAAILDERERQLQDQLLTGPPPLGPGAPPRERIKAFLEALAKLVESSYELLLVSENHTPGARYRIGSYGAWRLHLATLIRESSTARRDAELTADALLAPLAADLYRNQRRERGISAKRIRDNVISLADAALAAAEVGEPALAEAVQSTPSRDRPASRPQPNRPVDPSRTGQSTPAEPASRP